MKTGLMRQCGLLVLCIAVPLLAGAAGSFFTAPAIPGWYAGLEKPFFTPPSWVFAPAWTALYILMGISLFLIVKEGPWAGEKKAAIKAAIACFSLQLGLNVLWSVLFFYLRSPAGAFVVIIALVAGILATVVSFKKISMPAAWLLAPYLCWTCFAAVLNAAIVILN
jgi:tryptophan-rich sensory protein